VGDVPSALARTSSPEARSASRIVAGAAAVLSSLNTAAASSVYLREKTFAQ